MNGTWQWNGLIGYRCILFFANFLCMSLQAKKETVGRIREFQSKLAQGTDSLLNLTRCQASLKERSWDGWDFQTRWYSEPKSKERFRTEFFKVSATSSGIPDGIVQAPLTLIQHSCWLMGKEREGKRDDKQASSVQPSNQRSICFPLPIIHLPPKWIWWAESLILRQMQEPALGVWVLQIEEFGKCLMFIHFAQSELEVAAVHPILMNEVVF